MSSPHPDPGQQYPPGGHPHGGQPYGGQPYGGQPYAGPQPPPAYWGAPPPRQSDDQIWVIAAHLGPLLVGGFLAPLIVMLARGDDSPFVRRHAVESLNFQLTMLIVTIVGFLGACVVGALTLGFGVIVFMFLLLGAWLVAMIFMILATVAGSNGQDYRYPINIRMVS